MSEELVRFSPRQRAEHFVVMTLFILLSLTGFPQKFYDAAWARWVVELFGSVDRMRLVHRLCGIGLLAATVFHVGTGVFLLATRRARPTIVPTRQDFLDAVTTLRYYLGVSERQARFDRFDYRQKFEYWGLFLGSMVMLATGFVLYLPILVTRFLPGEVVPAAKVAHSNEGLMAFLVVITWHVYNAHFSPDTFPFDRTIFTGRISKERMVHEHPLEYERITGEPAHADHGDGEPAVGEGQHRGPEPPA